MSGVRPEELRTCVTSVAEKVRSFYDRYPYPPPVDNLDNYRRLWRDHQRRRADYRLFWPARAYREDQSILIAGCGTSQAAKHALRWPGAQVAGVDFSAASVRDTENLKRKYNLTNLQTYQLPLERVDELGMTFDQIVCTGVLHHLAEPDAGLKALCRVLKPDGAMHLMVYAPYGRAGIYLLQEFCRRIGVRATDEGLRELLSVLGALPPEHALARLLRESPDFRERTALADALLHPQDRAYSVPELFEFIERAKLTFGRWVRQAPYEPSCGVLANTPLAVRIARLSLVEQYAAVELFRGTMVRHSVIVYPNNRDRDPFLPDFTGDAWLNYVPIRMSDTICVQEQMPPGAAALLINQSHTFRDLLMPIDATEKRLFDAIDGNRSISEIVEGRPLDLARRLFERLWRHDQVVFDASYSHKVPMVPNENGETTV